MCHCNSHPHGVTGIKLHYIRLLAGLELVLSSTAPANNPTEHRAHIHHYTDFLHPISCILPSAHSFISPHLANLYYCLCSFPSLSIFLRTSSALPPPSPISLWESDASYFPPAFWDQAERQGERAELSKSLVVLIECIILLMFCHCCCTF